MKICDEIGIPAALEQAAEEGVEFSHAALKLSRILRGENPTPAEKIDTIMHLREEYADILTCCAVLLDCGLLDTAEAVEEAKKKAERWERRIREREVHDGS